MGLITLVSLLLQNNGFPIIKCVKKIFQRHFICPSPNQLGWLCSALGLCPSWPSQPLE